MTNFTDYGSREYYDACDIPMILDRDCTNWNDLLSGISTEIKLGAMYKLHLLALAEPGGWQGPWPPPT
jgi:hypothetical protein